MSCRRARGIIFDHPLSSFSFPIPDPPRLFNLIYPTSNQLTPFSPSPTYLTYYERNKERRRFQRAFSEAGRLRFSSVTYFLLLYLTCASSHPPIHRTKGWRNSASVLTREMNGGSFHSQKREGKRKDSTPRHSSTAWLLASQSRYQN